MLECLHVLYWTLLPAIVSAMAFFWYFFVTDRDAVLAIAENVGKSVSYYSRKVVWITGASSGLGEAMAYELASVGAKLILTARSEEILQSVKATCLDKSKGKLAEKDILVLSFDVAELETHQKYVDAVLEHFRKVDVFINNVGRGQMGNIHSTSFDVIENIFRVNVFAGIHLTQILLKHFLQTKKGQIIVVSGLMGKFGCPANAVYVTTKHALHGFYDSLRMEYNNDNISVTIACPGPFASNFTKKIVGTSEEKVFDNINTGFTQMSAKRCAHLSLVAGANNLYESWISYQPYLFFTLLAQHLPDVSKYLNNLVWTKKMLDILVNGKFSESLSPWKPLFTKEE